MSFVTASSTDRILDIVEQDGLCDNLMPSPCHPKVPLSLAEANALGRVQRFAEHVHSSHRNTKLEAVCIDSKGESINFNLDAVVPKGCFVNAPSPQHKFGVLARVNHVVLEFHVWSRLSPVYTLKSDVFHTVVLEPKSETHPIDPWVELDWESILEAPTLVAHGGYFLITVTVSTNTTITGLWDERPRCAVGQKRKHRPRNVGRMDVTRTLQLNHTAVYKTGGCDSSGGWRTEDWDPDDVRLLDRVAGF